MPLSEDRVSQVVDYRHVADGGSSGDGSRDVVVYRPSPLAGDALTKLELEHLRVVLRSGHLGQMHEVIEVRRVGCRLTGRQP
jgi:hypothetical protein